MQDTTAAFVGRSWCCRVCAPVAERPSHAIHGTPSSIPTAALFTLRSPRVTRLTLQVEPCVREECGLRVRRVLLFAPVDAETAFRVRVGVVEWACRRPPVVMPSSTRRRCFWSCLAKTLRLSGSWYLWLPLWRSRSCHRTWARN